MAVKSKYGKLSFRYIEENFPVESSSTFRITHNTWLKRICSYGKDYYYELWFHQTPILTFYRNGCVKLNSGGYKTYTTKQRLNQFGPVSVYQDKYEWFIGNHVAGRHIPFTDGMIILPNGTPLDMLLCSLPLTEGTPLPVAAGWLEENGRQGEAEILRTLPPGSYENPRKISPAY